MEKDFADLTPQELNAFLQIKYHFGLPTLALIVSEILLIPGMR